MYSLQLLKFSTEIWNTFKDIRKIADLNCFLTERIFSGFLAHIQDSEFFDSRDCFPLDSVFLISIFLSPVSRDFLCLGIRDFYPLHFSKISGIYAPGFGIFSRYPGVFSSWNRIFRQKANSDYKRQFYKNPISTIEDTPLYLFCYGQG